MSTALPEQPQSLAALYQLHQPWLLGWLRSKLGCRERAADLAQDTFVRILSAGEAAALREPRSYLATIARGLLIDHYRRQDLERAYLAALAQHDEASRISEEERAIVLETLCQIDAMLAGLGERPRQAFLLWQLEGLPQAEIAERLGVSLSSVKQYLHKATAHCLLIEAGLA